MVFLKELLYTVSMELPELLSSVFIMWGIIQCNFKRKVLPYILSAIIILFILSINILYGNQSNLPPLCFIIEIIVILLCFKDNFTRKISSFFIAYLISFIITMLIESVISLVFNMTILEKSEKVHMAVAILNISLVLFISLIIKRWKKIMAQQIRNTSSRYFLYILPGLFCSSVILAFFYIGKQKIGNYMWNRMVVFSMSLICIVYIIVTGLIIFLERSRKYYQMESKLKEQYMVMQKNYYKSMLENENDLRKFRHDIKAHMACMKILASQECYDELIKYINETTEMVDKLLEHTIHTGNETVDALMNYMVSEARKDGITIVMEGMFLKECTITSFDLCTLFYNTINNAIEACRNLMDNHTRKIQVCIKVYKHALLLMVENPICEPVDYRILEKGTTKPDKKIMALEYKILKIP